VKRRIAVGPTSLPVIVAREHAVVPPALWTPEAASALRPPTEREAERLVNWINRGGRLEALLRHVEELETKLQETGARIEAAPAKAAEAAEPWSPLKMKGLVWSMRAEDAVDIGNGRVMLEDRGPHGMHTIVEGHVVPSDPAFAGRQTVRLNGGVRFGGMTTATPPAPDEAPDPEPGTRGE